MIRRRSNTQENVACLIPLHSVDQTAINHSGVRGKQFAVAVAAVVVAVAVTFAVVVAVAVAVAVAAAAVAAAVGTTTHSSNN